MSDVKCPHCGEEQEICHDDGAGYEEDVNHEQHCRDCNKPFIFTTSVSYSYDVYCKDVEHDMENTHKDLWECKNCNHYEVRR